MPQKLKLLGSVPIMYTMLYVGMVFLEKKCRETDVVDLIYMPIYIIFSLLGLVINMLSNFKRCQTSNNIYAVKA